jgi:hypothetical protein
MRTEAATVRTRTAMYGQIKAARQPLRTILAGI